MEQIEHPQISNALRTGWPDGKAPVDPKCPVCGSECSFIFRRCREGDVLGCEDCTQTEDAWEAAECFPERNEL